jgi:hypothetical protein
VEIQVILLCIANTGLTAICGVCIANAGLSGEALLFVALPFVRTWGARTTGRELSSLPTERDSLRLCGAETTAAALRRLKDVAAPRHFKEGLQPWSVGLL